MSSVKSGGALFEYACPCYAHSQTIQGHILEKIHLKAYRNVQMETKRKVKMYIRAAKKRRMMQVQAQQCMDDSYVYD